MKPMLGGRDRRSEAGGIADDARWQILDLAIANIRGLGARRVPRRAVLCRICKCMKNESCSRRVFERRLVQMLQVLVSVGRMGWMEWEKHA